MLRTGVIIPSAGNQTTHNCNKIGRNVGRIDHFCPCMRGAAFPAYPFLHSLSIRLDGESESLDEVEPAAWSSVLRFGLGEVDAS
jgi:hypothetical protein